MSAPLPYTDRATGPTAAGRGTPSYEGGRTAARRYFYVRTPLRAFYGRALVGTASAVPVPFVPVFQPRLVPARPDWNRGCGLNRYEGARNG